MVGTCGCFGSDETLACFIAGCALNWDGLYHSEAEARHDSFNATMETVMNYGTFIFIGASMPLDQLHLPQVTGITYSRLVILGFLILLFRRIPAIMLGYRFMPKVCRDWKEALFMGYFAPIGRYTGAHITKLLLTGQAWEQLLMLNTADDYFQIPERFRMMPKSTILRQR